VRIFFKNIGDYMSKKLQATQDKIIKALRAGATMQIAADVAGVGR
jgi:hypothetical protein